MVGADAGSDRRFEALAPWLDDVAGRVVLDVHCGAGYVAFALARMGAAWVVGCEPSETHEQVAWLESVYRCGVRLERIG